jgi:hypothetical protein
MFKSIFSCFFLDGCEAELFLTFKNCEKELCFAPIQTVTALHLTLLLFLSKNFYYFYKVYDKNTTYETLTIPTSNYDTLPTFQKQHGDHDCHPTLTKPMPKLDEYKGSIGKKKCRIAKISLHHIDVAAQKRHKN